MNSKRSRWQHITDRAATTVRKVIVLQPLDYLNHERAKIHNINGMSKNYAFAGVGFHKVWQRPLMNLSDKCLKIAFRGTPKEDRDENFCGRWDNVDLEANAYPQLSSPNEAYRIRGVNARDGHLTKPARFTPIYNNLARKKISFTIKKHLSKPIFSISDLALKPQSTILDENPTQLGELQSDVTTVREKRKYKKKNGKRHKKKRKHNQ